MKILLAILSIISSMSSIWSCEVCEKEILSKYLEYWSDFLHGKDEEKILMKAKIECCDDILEIISNNHKKIIKLDK